MMELEIPVTVNGRLISTLGSFVTKGNKASHIEFNKKFIENGKIEDIEEVIKHECIHYALHKIGKPYQDGDTYFEDELIKHGIPSSKPINYQVKRNVRVYACQCREYIFLATVRRSQCTLCGDLLVYKEQRKEMV